MWVRNPRGEIQARNRRSECEPDVSGGMRAGQPEGSRVKRETRKKDSSGRGPRGCDQYPTGAGYCAVQRTDAVRRGNNAVSTASFLSEHCLQSGNDVNCVAHWEGAVAED